MDVRQVAEDVGSNPVVTDAAGRLGVTPERAKSVVEGVLQHIAGGGDQDKLIEAAAARAGIDPAKVQALLPHIMPAVEQHTQQAPASSQAELGQVLTSVRGLLGS